MPNRHHLSSRSRSLILLIAALFGISLFLEQMYFARRVQAVSATVVISEFRTVGPSGGNDEFIELYNLTNSPIDISGWKINGSNATAGTSTRLTISPGTSIPAHGHFLATNASASGYSGSVAGNQTYTTGITNDGGIALLNPSNVIIDQVGMSTGSAFKEGTVLTPLTTSTNRGYERKPGGANGSTQDTDNNGTDFQLLAPSDPQNLSSPPTPAGNQAIIPSCPTPLSTTQGTATSTGVSATDPDGTVTGAIITSATVAGITLDGFTPAPASGGTASATLNVADTTAQGSHNVVIQYSNNDSPSPQTASCTVVVNVNPPPTPTPTPTPTPSPTPDMTGTVVISQVYGGGGNAGASLKNDFIEIINHTGAPIDLSGWSVQYISATATTGSWAVTPLNSFILQPGQYYLIQEAAGAGGTVDLPTADTVGTIPMGATAGKVALVSNTTPLAATCPPGASVVDLVGYGGTANCFEGAGPAPTLSNTTAELRKDNGCTDTNNNNSDFSAGAPNPRNTSSSTNNCAVLKGTGTANPFGVQQGESTLLTVIVSPGSDPTSTGIEVTADLSSIGGSAAQSFAGSGNTFTFTATVSPSATLGGKLLPVTITDAQARTANTTIALIVQQPHVVISQVYGGGGNSGATYRNDFVELYNPTSVDFDLTGWSLQYASATGDGWEFTRQPLGGLIGPGEYYLIALGSSGPVGLPLPAANVTSDINIGATQGKLALVSNFEPLEGNCPIGDADIQDFVGYGVADCSETSTAPSPSSTMAILRRNDGATDTDNNSADFVTGAPNPRQTAPIVEIGPSVFGTDPRNNASAAPRDATISINFTEPVTVDIGWYDITCVSTGNHNSATVRSFFGGDTHTITPNVNFLAGEQCTVTIFKDAIHDVDTDDSGTNADSLPANKVFTFTVATGTAPPYPSSVHLTMGNPSGSAVVNDDNYLMDKPEFTLSYNRSRGTANWVSWHLSDDWIGTLARVDTFRADPAVPEDWFRVSGFDYVGSGFDRGHMVPNADRDKETSIPINQATFLMTNMIPQSPDNNQGPWANMEGYLRTLLPANELYIVAGGAGIGGTGSAGSASTIAGGNVTVPAQTWKVVLVMPKDSGDDVTRVTCASRAVAVIMPNIQGIRNVDWQTYIVPVAQVESLTGYNFFSNLPDAIEHCVEAGTNGTNPPGTADSSATTNEDTAVGITLTASSPGGTLTYTIVSGPTHGELTGSDGNRTYTPDLNYFGPDSFTFKVNDGANDSNTSTVSITVNSVNDDPDAVDDVATVAEDSGANTINVQGNDSDVEGDTRTIVSVTQGTNGSVAITNSGADLSYTPAANYFGSDSFTYTIEDGNGGSDTATVSITVTNVNDAPVLTSSVAVSLISATNSNLFNVGLTASATDQEGEAVTIQVAVFGDEDDQTATLPGVVHSPDAKDIAPVTLRLRGERIEASDGRVYLIVVTATDSSGGVSRNYHTVVVPKNNKQSNVNLVNAQAAAAIAYASSNGGTPPPGYFVIGDGPIIGPKQ
jgi:DNA/RNA endonuclease G (NUC1)